MSSKDKQPSVSLRNHYSRFLECFELEANAFDNYSCKSDQWIMHFIEDCYEDAVQSCDKANESNSDNCIDVDRPHLGMISIVKIKIRVFLFYHFFDVFHAGHRIHPTHFPQHNCERLQIGELT